MKSKLLMAAICTIFVGCSDEAEYEELTLIVETPHGTFPCFLTDSYSDNQKRKWNGVKREVDVGNEIGTECTVRVERGLYESCYLTGLKMWDSNKVTEKSCSYSHPSYFSASLLKEKETYGIMGITCTFLCRLEE